MVKMKVTLKSWDSTEMTMTWTSAAILIALVLLPRHASNRGSTAIGS
jgi:hypothetical protein